LQIYKVLTKKEKELIYFSLKLKIKYKISFML
jgi:hypothetical protein